MVHGSMEIVHEGMLKKSPPPKRLWRAKWRMRWFVLRSGELPGQYFLEYYTDRTCRKLKGKIDLDQCDQVDAGITFANRKSEYKYMFDIKTPKRIYYLCAETEQEMNRWVDCVCQVCGLKMYSQEDDYPMPPFDHLQGNTIPATPPAPVHSLPIDQPHLDSPPLSPTSQSSSISGPYIPISECITGKRTPITGTAFHFSDEMPNIVSTDNHRSSIPNEMAPPAPVGLDGPPPLTQAPLAPHSNTGAIPRESYDTQRSLRPSGATSEDTLSVQSPHGTDGSSVFSDDDRAMTPPKAEAKFFSESFRVSSTAQNPKDGPWEGHGAAGGMTAATGAANLGNDLKGMVLVDDDHQGMIAAPPRPPKPAHLTELPQQTYQNLDTIVRTTLIRKNSSNDKVRNGLAGSSLSHDTNIGLSDPEPSPASISSSVPPSTPHDVSDDMHPAMRLTQQDTVSPQAADRLKQRHCYNNFAAPSVQGQIFSYDMRAYDTGEKHVELDPRISPAGLYSNIPQTNKSPFQPPAVDRGLKPRKISDVNISSSELSPPPSGGVLDVRGAVGGSPVPPASAPPVVDRNLKPLNKNPPEVTGKNMFVLDPAPIRLRKHDQKMRAAPSPTPPSMRNGRGTNDSGDETHSNPTSRRNSTNADEQIFFPLSSARHSQHEIQYLDLDLHPDARHSPKSLKASTSKSAATASSASVVYKTVDFVKTEAFNKMRINVEDSYRKNQ